MDPRVKQFESQHGDIGRTQTTMVLQNPHSTQQGKQIVMKVRVHSQTRLDRCSTSSEGTELESDQLSFQGLCLPHGSTKMSA